MSVYGHDMKLFRMGLIKVYLKAFVVKDLASSLVLKIVHPENDCY